MSDDYTPTTDDIRSGYSLSKDDRDMSKYRYDPNAAIAEWERIRDTAYADFDRWYASVLAEGIRVGREQMREEAETVCWSYMPFNPRSDWTEYARGVGTTVERVVKHIRALPLTPGSDKKEGEDDE